MDNIKGSGRKMAKNTIYLTIRMVFVTLISIFTTRYLLQNLGVEDYGIYNVTLGIVMICGFLRPSLAHATQRFYNYELGRDNIEGATTVFTAGFLVQVMFAILIVVICETIGLWYLYNKLVVPDGRFEAVFWVYQIALLSVCLQMLQVPYTASVMAHERMNFYAVLNITDAVFKLIIAIAIKYTTYDHLVFYALLLLGITIFNLVSNFIYCKLKFPEVRLKFENVKTMLRSLFSFSFWNLFESLARIGKDQGGNMLLNYYFGPNLNAARGVTSQISYALSSFVESVGTATRPQMIQRYARGEVSSSVSIFMTSSKLVFLIIALFGCPLFLEIDYILKIWLGSNVPQYTDFFVRIIILYLLVDKLAMPVTALIHASGNIKMYHIIASMMNLLTIPIIWILFSYGFSAATLYWVFFFIAFIAQILFVMLLSRQIRISSSRYLLEIILKPLATLLLSAVLPVYLHTIMEESLNRLMAVSLSMLVMMSVIGYVICVDKSEQALIKSFIKR